MMQMTFLNAAGVVQFSRNDIIDGHWIQEEYTVNAVFPHIPGKVIERGMRICFRDPATGDMEVYEVRNVKNTEPDNLQNLVAEHIAVAELSDEHCTTAKITDNTPAQALTSVLTGTLWAVGNSTVSALSSVDIPRGSVWDAVNAIKRNWNVYITPRVTFNTAGTITGRYLDITPAEATWRGVRLSIDKNMSDSTVIVDDSEVLTALYGYGGSVNVSHSGGDDTQESLTFADVEWSSTSEHPAKPLNQTYIEDPTKTALYGRNGRARYGYYQNGSITDPAILLQKTWEALQATSDPKITISGTVTELKRLGLADVPMRWHDLAIVEIRQTSQKYQLEIIKLDVDLVNPNNTRPEIGAYIPNIVYINRENNKGGGGGGGGRGQDNEEERTEWFDSEFIRQQQMIGMVVGLRNGDGYIKAASIVASINDDGGTNIHLSADVIDIDGVVTKLLTKEISCKSIHTTTGSNLFEGKCSFPDEVVIPTQLTLYNRSDGDWLTTTIPTFTYSQAHNFVYRLNGQDYTVNGYIIGTKGTKTIHYFGYPDS